MKITADTRLNRVLDLNPQVVDYIVSLNPHEFARLHNPLMRRLMAPRITVGRVAAMTHTPLPELLDRIAALGGAMVGQEEQPLPLAQSPVEQPAWVAAADPATVTIVDLLSIDAALDADPMLPVIVAVKALAPGAVCLIRHAWEPQPLYDLWSKMGGLAWFAEQVREDEWWTWVRRTPPAEAGA